MKIKVQINKILKDSSENNGPKTDSLTKILKPQDRLTKEKREKTQMIRLINENGEITVDTTEILIEIIMEIYMQTN